MLCTRCLPGFPLAATFIIALIIVVIAGCGGGDGPAPTDPPARTGGPTSAPPSPEATGAPASPGLSRRHGLSGVPFRWRQRISTHGGAFSHRRPGCSRCPQADLTGGVPGPAVGNRHAAALPDSGPARLP